MEENRAKKTFIAGAVLLGAAGILVKVLGLFFRIPLTNIIGADGIGYYQTAYPVYTFMLTISSSGLPTAISKMISERRSTGEYYEAYRVFRISFKVMLALGLGTGLVLFIFAPLITGQIQKEPDAVYAMRSMAPALILCPVLSCYRGFFQGQRNMAPTAISQLVEQIFRVGLGLGLALILRKIDLAHAAAGASFGASAGALFGLIAIMFIFQANRPRMLSEIKTSGRKPKQSSRSIMHDLLAIAIPTTIGSCILPILNTIDTVIVKRRLLGLGYPDEIARTMYGELSGMASPIINIIQVITQAICLSLVPVISDAYRRDDMDFVRKNVSLGLRYAFTVGLPCAVGMFTLARPIMQLFYPTQTASLDNAAACLRIYTIGLVFLAVNHSLTGVLQGIGRQGIPVRNLFIGAIVKTVVTFVLTGIPSINVRGAAVGTAVAYLVAAGLNYVAVKKYTYVKVDVVLTVIKPVIAAAVMGICVFGGYRLVHAKMGNTVSTLAGVAAGVIVYVLMVFITRAITAEELESMPKLGKLARVLKKLHLVK